VKLAIVDVGCGNIGSVAIAFERFGLTPIVTADAEEIASADRIVLPGVGAAGYAMARIDAIGLKQRITALAQPVLGICLGMQLLFAHSEEDDTSCLAILPGSVRKLTPAPGRPVPHMGWSKLAVSEDGFGLSEGDYVYFANSYACDDGPWSVATADYGRSIPAAVRKDNFLGAQFHPERSSAAGACFLEAFLAS